MFSLRERCIASFYRCALIAAAVLLACVHVSTSEARANAGRTFAQLVQGADLVLEGKVTKHMSHTTLEVFPVIHQLRFQIGASQIIKGRLPAGQVTFQYSTRRRSALPRKGLRYLMVLQCTMQTLEQKQQLCRVVRSWPAKAELRAKALAIVAKAKQRWGAVGGAVQFLIEQVRPQWQHDWKNPRGDGKFRLVLYNPTLKPITISALRASGKGASRVIYWRQALRVQAGHTLYQLQGARAVIPRTATSLRLLGRERVSTLVDVLPLPRKHWPGGGNLHYTFSLGEQSRTSSFYFSHNFHTPMRQKMLAKASFYRISQKQTTKAKTQTSTSIASKVATKPNARPLPKRCTLPPWRGFCHAKFTNYYYDVKAGKCRKFIYNGCRGNQNNFITRKACQRACR